MAKVKLLLVLCKLTICHGYPGSKIVWWARPFRNDERVWSNPYTKAVTMECHYGLVVT